MAGATALPQDQASDLLVARRFLLDAEEAVVSRDELSVRRGLLLADLASETLLKLGLRHFGVEVGEFRKFPELLGDVQAAGKEHSLPLSYLRDPLLRLRSMRNAVMHEGIAQDPPSSRRAVASARRALTRLVADVFQRDFE